MKSHGHFGGSWAEEDANWIEADVLWPQNHHEAQLFFCVCESTIKESPLNHGIVQQTMFDMLITLRESKMACWKMDHKDQ